MRSISNLLYASLSLISLVATASEPASVREDDTFDLNVPDAAVISPEAASADENAGFAGNPAGDWMSWWPKDLVLAPIPSRSPEFGWGLAVAAGYFMDLDKDNPDTPNSSVGIVGKYTENKSWAAGLGGKFNLLNDNVRIRGGVAYMDINYKFYGIGNGAGDEGQSVDIAQQAPLAYVSGTYQIFPNLYAGLGFLGGTVETAADPGVALPPDAPADINLDLNVNALEIPLQYDTRDDDIYPRSGWLVDVRGFIQREALGTDFDSESVSIAANHYRSMRKRDVLAFRAYTRATGGDTPFFLLSSFGGRTDLRGYESGRYRDNVMYAVQTEYRWQPLDRWIFTGFVGVGEVAEDYGSFFDNFLPAAGAGARFVLSPRHQLNLALDVGVGKHGAEFYFAIGEAF